MKAILSRSAICATVLLLGLIIFSARPSIADTVLSKLQEPKPESQDPKSQLQEAKDASLERTGVGQDSPATTSPPLPLGPASNYVATAYSLRGRTASGRMVSRGIIAADPRILPLGSRVRLEHPGYTGEYLVADTGGLIKGKRIDIWIPSTREAMRFGRRTVKLTVLSYGMKRNRRFAKA